MARDRTETIKQRAIYVYLPSEEMTDKWKERADKEGISISKFVIENVENSLNPLNYFRNNKILIK